MPLDGHTYHWGGGLGMLKVLQMRYDERLLPSSEFSAMRLKQSRFQTVQAASGSSSMASSRTVF